MHEFSINFVKCTSYLVSNIGHVELKIHVNEQWELKVTIKENMIKCSMSKVPCRRRGQTKLDLGLGFGGENAGK